MSVKTEQYTARMHFFFLMGKKILITYNSKVKHGGQAAHGMHTKYLTKILNKTEYNYYIAKLNK